MERYRVTYARKADLVRDLDAQLARGGLFVTAPPPSDLGYASRCALEIVCPGGRAVSCEGAVLAAMPGQGVAIAVDPTVVSELRALASALGPDPASAGEPVHERVTAAAQPPREAPAEVAQTWDALPAAEKMRLAQHGGRDERAAALRDRNRALHPMVLKNPRLTLDEVVAVARNPQSSPDLLKLISERSDWSSRSTVAEALARNPRSPNEVGVKSLGACSAEALRQMAKGQGAPPHVCQAARKRVLG